MLSTESVASCNGILFIIKRLCNKTCHSHIHNRSDDTSLLFHWMGISVVQIKSESSELTDGWISDGVAFRHHTGGVLKLVPVFGSRGALVKLTSVSSITDLKSHQQKQIMRIEVAKTKHSHIILFVCKYFKSTIRMDKSISTCYKPA